MKILQVCAVGFTIKYLLRSQIDYFSNSGLLVEIACSPGKEVKELKQQGYIIHSLKIERRISVFSNLNSIYQLVKLIRKNQYDLIHVHTPIASVLARIAAKIAGEKRVVYTAHGFYFHENMPRKQYRFYYRVEKLSGLLTNLILTQSREDLVTAEKTGLCSPQKLYYLGNGVNIERFCRSNLNSECQQQRKRDFKLPDVPIIATTGRITAEKGYLELVKALVKLRSQLNVHLLVIGGQLSSERDAFQSQLNSFIQEHNLEDCVTFTGLCSDIPELLGLVDVFTLPSYREGLPRSILEAMAMELPFVATDIRGCREAVIHNQTGLLVPPRNSNQLAEALGTILTNTQLKKSFGKAGRQRVEAEYDERFVFERLARCYKELGIL